MYDSIVEDGDGDDEGCEEEDLDAETDEDDVLAAVESVFVTCAGEDSSAYWRI